MRRPRRFAATAAVLLCLQLLVLGSGVACAMAVAMPGMHDVGGSSMVSMGSMSGAPSRAEAPGATHPPADHRAPCRIPWAPADCSGMAPCTPAAMISSAIVLGPTPVMPNDDVHLVVLAPSSISAPPELPPPRA